MMLRKFCLVGLFLFLAASIWCLCRSPGLDDWPQFDGFRCRECGGPVSVHPDDVRCWGCAECRRVAWEGRLDRYFRQSVRGDFPSKAAFDAAHRQAGLLAARCEDWEHTPASVWARSVGNAYSR